MVVVDIANLDLKMGIAYTDYNLAVGTCCGNIISAGKTPIDCTSCSTSVTQYAAFETACKDNDGKMCTAKMSKPDVLKMELKLCIPKTNCTTSEVAQSETGTDGTTASVSCGMSGVVIALIVIIVIVAIIVIGGVLFFFLKKRSSSTLAY